MATLAEQERLNRLEQNLLAHAQDITGTGRSWRRLFLTTDTGAFPVLHTPIQNLAAATWIVDSIQSSGSVADDIHHITAMLKVALEQNNAVMQSHNRGHSKAARADTVASAHSPHGGHRANSSPPHQDASPCRRGDVPHH